MLFRSFDITDALVSYSSNSTYWDALVVGFLNTIRVSLLGIVLATIIGFVMGVARLSRNWLVAKIGTLYVEIFRNVPLLLWMFIIYGAMLQPLPGPKQAINILDSFFLSNRGLMVPKPSFEQGAWLGLAGFAAAIAAVLAIRRWAKARQEKSGEVFPIFWTGAVLIVGLPFVGFALAGFPITWSYPELKGFNFQGGTVIQPEFTALLLGLVRVVRWPTRVAPGMLLAPSNAFGSGPEGTRLSTQPSSAAPSSGSLPTPTPRRARPTSCPSPTPSTAPIARSSSSCPTASAPRAATGRPRSWPRTAGWRRSPSSPARWARRPRR